MPVRVHGLAPREGDAAFAFLVLRLATPVDRAGLVDLLQQIAPLVPDADSFAAELPDDEEDAMRLIGMPWSPPEAGHAFDVQRRLIEGAALHGIAEAWFFQTGTSLPAVGGDDDEDDDDDGGGGGGGGGEGDAAGDDDEQPGEAEAERDVQTQTTLHVSTDDGWGDLDLGGDAGTTLPMSRATIEEAAESEHAEPDDDGDGDDDVVADVRGPGAVAEPDDGERAEQDGGGHGGGGDADDGGDDDGEAGWSHGPPPQATQVRFPVDGYPEILEELDWEDFGIAFKLGGPWTPGERTVLIGFHAMWLAPYGGRYRNAAVTIDQRHHAAHLWVDRFAVPSSAREQVHHLLWVVSKLDEVMPVVHARFGGATMAQKYGGVMGDTSEPFVLGGNPLIALHTLGGEGGIDAWIAAQTTWSSEEVAQMLRELAIDLATRRAPSDARFDAEHEDDDEDGEDADADDGGLASEDDDQDDDEVGRSSDDDGSDADVDAERTRHLTTYAGELLAERARAGVLDPRAAELLRPVLGVAEKHEHRRTAVVSVLGAARDRDSVPAMIRILEDTPIPSGLDATGKQELLTATVTALGEIADPAAIPALARRIVAPGAHHDELRAAAACALAACLTVAPRPEHPGPELDDATFAALARSIRETSDDGDVAELHLAYGELANALPPARREAARERLRALEVDDGDGMAMLARGAALALTGDAQPDAQITAALRSQVHAALTELDDDHDATIRKIRVALRVAAWSPGLVDPADLVRLTRLAEPDVRGRAHALLETAGQRMPPATAFDRRAARTLSDDDLVRWIGEPHVVGRAALVAEAAGRALAAARPAILGAAHAVIDGVRGGHNLLDPEARLLEAAVAALRDGPLDAGTAGLFDRMLRHANHHVKWELLQAPPRDERLIGGMFHVLGERWGWQETAAKEWLSSYAGTAVYEAERNRAPGADPGATAHDDDNVN